MPTDIDTFNMLRDNVLQSMTKEQLFEELKRVDKMNDAVRLYQSRVIAAFGRDKQ